MAEPIAGRRRSVWFTGPRQVEVRDDDLGPLAPGHLLVRSQCSAISAGTELLAFRGELPPRLALDETIGALGTGTFRHPFRYGYAQVGEVIGVGTGVAGVGHGIGGGDGAGAASWLGRRVFAFHQHASTFVVPAADALLVPHELESGRAVLFAHMETAVNLVLDGAPGFGDRVLVIGLGVIGLLTAALLARFPLAVLTAVETVDARARAARAFGVGTVVRGAGDVDAAFGPAGADLVYELSGNPDALDLAIAAAGHEAHVVVGSWYGDKRAPVDLGGRFHRRRLRLSSSQVSHIGAPLTARWDRARRAAAAWRALADIDTSALVTHRFPLSDAQAAYELLDRRAPDVLQVLLEPDDDTRGAPVRGASRRKDT